MDASNLEFARGMTGVESNARLYGVYPATILDIRDPDAQGRVKIGLPWMPDSQGGQYAVWARLATLMAGKGRGTWFIPDAGDEVLVAFQAGDPRFPFVVGSMWNGKDEPPDSMDGSDKNYRKVIRSRSGLKITMDDQDGAEKIVLETPKGQKLTMQDGAGTIEISDQNGNSVKMESHGITVNASAKVTIKAAEVTVAAGSVAINAATAKFSGVVECDTMIANNVIASTYSPGVGNIM